MGIRLTKNKESQILSDREYWQMYTLAELLEKDSKCDFCQCLIEKHSILMLQSCLQELSKSHAEFVKEVVDSFDY